MKTLTFLISLASLFLFGCSKESPSGAAPSGSSAAKTTENRDAEGHRVVRVQANDTMKYDVTSISAAPGETIVIELVNTGSAPKEAMGHNMVILKPGSDSQAFSNAASTAKDSDYIPSALTDEIVAHTKLLGPGQSDKITFTAPSEPATYPYLCSFPAHYAVGMKGEIEVK